MAETDPTAAGTAAASTGDTVNATAPNAATANPRAALTDAEKVQFWKKNSYFETLPEDIAPMRRLLTEYSHMPADAIDAHLYAIRDKLWAVGKYPCIGRFSFLNLGMTKTVYYQEVIDRLKSVSAGQNKQNKNERLLDIGCCVGQVLRQLVHEGVDPQKLAGADLHREFIDLGYEMFGDGASASGKAFTFVAGDIFADSPSPYDALKHSVTMIHAANFFHLFTWDEQVKAAVRIVGFLDDTSSDASAGDSGDAPTGISIFGAQLGHRSPGEYRIVPLSPRMRYLHDATTFQKLWDEVGAATGTRWRTATAPLTSGIGEALTGNANVMYVLFGVWRVRG